MLGFKVRPKKNWSYLNSTPICFSLRQTTAQRRAAVSISSTSLKLSGISPRFAASIAAAAC
jgi:hypothetical protein